MTISTVEEDELTPKTLNNFLVSMREGVRQARVHLIHHHTRRIKALAKETSSAATRRNVAPCTNSSSNSAVPNSSTKPADISIVVVAHPIKKKNKQKALKLGKEIKAVKSFSDGDLGKLVLLNTKTFNQAAREKCSSGQRAVCRLAEHEALKKCKQQFADKFGDSVKQLPFCIKVLGVSRRYKKLRKLDKRGKKEKFLENQRFCLRLLREIGGSDFASAEDLFRKMGKQKKKLSVTEKSKMDKPGDGDGGDCDDDTDDDHSAAEESSSCDEDETQQQKEVKNKIHQRLDALLGKWDDCESDSDSEMADVVGSRRTVAKETKESAKSILAKVPNPSKSQTKPGKIKSVCDTPIISNEVSQPCTIMNEESDNVSKKIQQSSTQSTKSTIKSTRKRVELKDKNPSLMAPSAFFASFAAKQIDLEKVKATGVIPSGSKKRGRKLNPEDELEELPRKLAERNKRRALKRTLAETEITTHNEDDDDKFDPTKFNIRFNAKKLGEALLQKDDIRKPIGVATRGSGGAGRRGSRGGALANGRGGARGRGSGAREGVGAGTRNTHVGSERGTQQRGPRGRGFHKDNSDGDRGRSSQRVPERGRGAGFKNSSSNTAESSQCNEHIHPSWAAKKQQKMGISAFQGKKITFD